MSAPARRRAVAYATHRGVSARRACALFQVARSTLGYASRLAAKDAPVVTDMRTLAAQYPRYGYRRIQCSCDARATDWGSTGPTDCGGRPVSRRNLRYKRYGPSAGEGARVWAECQERAAPLRPLGSPFVVRETPPRLGDPVLVRPRLGQGAFRVAVTHAYHRACAATGEHSLPVLEAAHIRPYAQGGTHEVSNGLLLRSDRHRLFDTRYLTVTPELRLEVSSKLKGEYESGRTYYPMHGTVISTPDRVSVRPQSDLLRWHNEVVYRG